MVSWSEKNESKVFVVQGGSKKIDKNSIVDLDFTKEDLREMINFFLQKVYRAKEKGEIKKIVKKLENSIASKIAKKLDDLGVKKVLYLPHSYLSYLPLSASKYQGKALFERHTFQHLSNLYDLQDIDKKSENKKQLFSVINPTKDLKFTPIEGKIVSLMFKNSVILEEENATKKSVLNYFKSSFDYIYFSGHGAFDMDNPMKTGLLMSDEKLTLSDIFSKTDLTGSRLVMLSACQTDMKDLDMISESIGLPEAFLESGAKGVISTLWSVDDISTMFLTIRFFELHIKEGYEPPIALSKAKSWFKNITAKELQSRLSSHMNELKSDKKLLKSLASFKAKLMNFPKDSKPFSDPFHWAGFVYTGR